MAEYLSSAARLLKQNLMATVSFYSSRERDSLDLESQQLGAY